MTIKLSIIVPVYNVKQYLSKCIESILVQSYKNLEIIIVNDGSTDGSGEICDYYRLIDSRIKVIHKINEGVSIARNTGLEMATGDYIGFIDGDDYIDEDMYEFLLNNAIKNDADISHCGFYITIEEDNYLGLGGNKRLLLSNVEGVAECLKSENFILSTWNKLYKREIIENIRFEERRAISEDTLFNYQAFSNCRRSIYDGQPKYYYVQRNASAINSPFSYKNLDTIYFNNKIFKLTKQNYPQLIYLAEKREVVSNILTMRRIIIDNKKNEFLADYRIILKKIRVYSKKCFRNNFIPIRWKILVFVFAVSPHMGSYIMEKYSSRQNYLYKE